MVLVALLVGYGAARRTPNRSAPPGELSTLPVPGGPWALAELGVPPSVERASALRILVQRRYDASPAVRLTDEAALARVQAQLDLAVQVEQAARLANPQGALSLSSVTTRQSRDRLRAAVEAFGARLHERRQRYTVELADGRRERELQAALRQLGLDPTDLAARLNQGETVTVEVPPTGCPWRSPRPPGRGSSSSATCRRGRSSPSCCATRTRC